jgi:hypothetical protein
MDRYNPCVMDLLAEPMRSRVIELFASCGVVAYDAYDWEELGIVRRQLKVHFPRYADLAD